MDTKALKAKTLAKSLRWAGRIIVLPVAVFFLTFAIGELIDTVSSQGVQQAYNFGGIVGGITILIAFVGGLISFWWLFPAGVLLIFAYLFGGISSVAVAVYHVGEFHFRQFSDFWTIPNILYLVAGILFLVSMRISRKINTQAKV